MALSLTEIPFTEIGFLTVFAVHILFRPRNVANCTRPRFNSRVNLFRFSLLRVTENHNFSPTCFCETEKRHRVAAQPTLARFFDLNERLGA